MVTLPISLPSGSTSTASALCAIAGVIARLPAAASIAANVRVMVVLPLVIFAWNVEN
jgi:hypothetical protein